MNLVRKTRARVASIAIWIAILIVGAFMIFPSEWASGATATGFQTARFKVEIKGVQKTVQQHTHLAEEECDLTDISSGSEKIVFRTKPIVITASHVPGQFNPYLLARATPQGIPATAKITRSYTPRITMPSDPECGRNGGGSVELKPDCGTRTVGVWRLDLEYDEQRKNGVFLAADEGDDPFTNCPVAGDMLAFPFLDTTTTGGKTITAQVSQDELFDPGIGKWIAIAKGSRRYDAQDYWAKATVEWDVSFTRLH
jgi:hypothetical protein